MGISSLILGACVGFYFRNTIYGSHLANKLFAAYKLLQKHSTGQYKLVLVVRDDLAMSRGKIASQCSHASVLAYKTSLFHNPETTRLWEAFGQPKVIVKANNEQTILKLYEASRSLGLCTNIVSDAGRTEVASGTKTVLAVGPGPNEIVDKVTAHLKLL